MMGGRDWSEVAQGLKPAAAMVLIQTAFAGVNILYKLALNDGMDVKVLVAYRYIFAAAFISPVAFFVERKRRPKITWKILGLTFLCGLLGLERLGIRTNYGRAKVLGTLLGLGGAMLLTFYKGAGIQLWSTNINLSEQQDHGGHHLAAPHSESGNRVMGSFLAVASCLCYAVWLIIQAKLAQAYPCHYSNAALMCLMGSIQASILALCVERHRIQWRLGFDIRLLTAAYSGIFASGMSFTLLGWCIKKKGPVYASVFNPLMLVLVAIFSSLLLDENLLGAALIVIGLYIVLWGKGREASKIDEESPAEATRESIEVVVAQEAATDPGSGNRSQTSLFQITTQPNPTLINQTSRPSESKALGLRLVPSYLISTPSQISSLLPLLAFPSLSVHPHRVIAAAPRGPFTPIPDPAHRQERGCGQQFPERALPTGLFLEGEKVNAPSI
ncbi:EamA-like transporter family [Musa troglodytarum]|uniref:EamA-like transporter family n=1 Tax=Musa troglodytarum TaxID=320322 RepID=A0A9E7GA67_9LILI|nr:EamA-like transporter family [Musa troglodytarum]